MLNYAMRKELNDYDEVIDLNFVSLYLLVYYDLSIVLDVYCDREYQYLREEIEIRNSLRDERSNHIKFRLFR